MAAGDLPLLPLLFGKIDVNILICSSQTPDSRFLFYHLQTLLERRGVEPVILSFPDLAGMTEYMAVSPDAPDALFLICQKQDAAYLDAVEQLAKVYPNTNIVLIGDAPADIERLFAIGIFYYMYPGVTHERYLRLERRLSAAWFVDKEKYYILENKKNTLRIAYSDILYVMSDKRKVIIYQPNGKTDSLYCKLDEMEEKLDDRFIRCHQSYLINVQYIRGIETDGFLMIDDVFVPISQKKYWASKRRYVQYIQNQG